jgi:predicted esterase
MLRPAHWHPAGAVALVFVLFALVLSTEGPRARAAERARAVTPLAPPTAEPPRVPEAHAPRWMPVDGHPVLVYSPESASVVPQARRVIVMLHGMCDTPENECSRFHAASSGFLVCPRANGECGNGGAIWRGPFASKQALVAGSLQALKSELGDAIDTEHEATLIGFSQGAYLALNLVTDDANPFSKLILIGASVEPDVRVLKRAGVRRVLLAAGDYDGAKTNMQRAAARLASEGFDARYMSLGLVGHQFAVDMDGWMRRALSWVDGEDDAKAR